MVKKKTNDKYVTATPGGLKAVQPRRMKRINVKGKAIATARGGSKMPVKRS